ncbi:hypothetical protein HDR63_02740 [bacterium]|nr:hypothetical protein [bacterium]
MNQAFRKFLMGAAIVGGTMMPARGMAATPRMTAPTQTAVAPASDAPNAPQGVSDMWKNVIFFGAMGAVLAGLMAGVWHLTVGQARRDYRAMETRIRDAHARAQKDKERS